MLFYAQINNFEFKKDLSRLEKQLYLHLGKKNWTIFLNFFISNSGLLNKSVLFKISLATILVLQCFLSHSCNRYQF